MPALPRSAACVPLASEIERVVDLEGFVTCRRRPRCKFSSEIIPRSSSSLPTLTSDIHCLVVDSMRGETRADQVCRAYNVPYVSLRALSDLITGDANADFNAFCETAADNLFPMVPSALQLNRVSSLQFIV